MFRDTGVAHLMAISGLHVTMFAWLASALIAAGWRASARWSPALLWRWPATQAGAVGGLLLASAYAVFSGWGVPSQRTVLMLAVVTLLRWRGADWPWPLVWGWAMAAVLLLDPWALLHAGFWLSFVAVGVLLAAGRYPASGRLGALPGLLREQALMTVALAPLTLLLFGQVSLVSLLANLPAIPWVTLVVTPLAMLGVLFSPLWEVAAWGVRMLGLWLEQLATWPWAVWHHAAAPWGWAVLGVAGGVLLVWRLPWPWRMAGALMLWPAFTHAPPRPPPGVFELLALDVGQGSAVLVRTATHSLLFDTGPRYWGGGDAGQLTIVPALRRLGERLDLVVESHADSDHAGGTPAVLAAQPRARFLAPLPPPEGSLAAARAGLPGLGALCRAGQRWQWDGVGFEMLHPRPEDLSGSSNATSCVLRVSSGGRAAVLTGDIGVEQELRLALEHPDLRADWLLAPHHGSRSSSLPAWLNTLRPRWVFIQAGHHNRFGHPAPVVLTRYAQRGIVWRSSPSCGAATWRSDAPDTLRCERDDHPRYWRTNPPELRP